MNKYINYLITSLLVITTCLCLYFFEIRPTAIVKDYATNALLTSTLTRLSILSLFIWIAYNNGSSHILRFNSRFFKHLLICSPCLLVALANFPYSSLINGTMRINRMELLPLYIVLILSIALLEEFIFRGLVTSYVFSLLKNRNVRYPYLLTAVCASALFSLIHLTNLFVGASLQSVLLQIVYSFLLGAMLTVVMFKTHDIWVCVLIHALFNFGGLLNGYIAVGNPWDTLFWILTICCGCLCAGHIIVALIRMENKYAS